MSEELEVVKKKNIVPNKYSANKVALIKALWNTNPDYYEKIRDAIIPTSVKMIQFIKEKAPELINEFIEKDKSYQGSFIKEFFIKYPELIDQLHTSLPKPPEKCGVCGSNHKIDEDGTVFCSGDKTDGKCIIIKRNINFPSIEDWNREWSSE